MPDQLVGWVFQGLMCTKDWEISQERSHFLGSPGGKLDIVNKTLIFRAEKWFRVEPQVDSCVVPETGKRGLWVKNERRWEKKREWERGGEERKKRREEGVEKGREGGKKGGRKEKKDKSMRPGRSDFRRAVATVPWAWVSAAFPGTAVSLA